MAEKKDYIDIQRENVLTADQLEFAKENPFGLTREGCQVEIENWRKSNNRHQLAMYEYMLKTCKEFTQSGKTVDGRVILARDKKSGKITWAEHLDEHGRPFTPPT